MTTPQKPTSSSSSSSSKISLLTLANYTVFTFLSIILLCFILLTPADAIYQCYFTRRLTNIFIITGGYFVTFLLAALIYATRIYTNRSVLSGIPKAWIPIEKEDVSKSVRRLVKEGLGRSALVARGVRPRDLTSSLARVASAGVDGDGDGEGLLRELGFAIDPANPPWGGGIEHPGWSAPAPSSSSSAAQSDDLGLPKGLCYRTVVKELPHLIEAKAVSLAPPDPSSQFRRQPQTQTPTRTLNAAEQLQPPQFNEEEEEDDNAVPDTRIVEILRRPAAMSLRTYVNHLTNLDVINPPETGLEFLSLYERARFSGRDLYEFEFQELMSVFADVLRGMSFVLQDRHRHHLNMVLDGGDDNRSIFGTGTGTPSESVIGPSDEEGETETDTLGSVSVNSLGYRYDAEGGRGRLVQRWPRTPSMHSLRPARSNVSGSSGSGSGSGGSVIRLVDANSSPTRLPYAIDR